ncbi:glycosyltransferase family 2 protein [Hufsiella ginkgonis]|uniref:Glycosyltransferase n=1 Tax=Hufsiella ginkgonis TaxID=2695274 RepID=A0A7K1XZA4_9SPHI|nr:glycosyltransferase family 2 protein [Hufsiella ginkgonis]MXV16300.1 glycosyltransferase [Hufsiella ginkgonis]
MASISVITVNFNQPLVTEELIHSIQAQGSTVTEIIVVDNGSKINHVPEWTTRYPHISFIRSNTNLGFAGGNNLGIKAATGDYLFLVNNDTEFTPRLAETLADTLDRFPSVAVVSPKIRFFSVPDTIQYVGFTPMNYYTIQNASPGYLEKDRGQYDNIERETGFVHGAAMMIRKEAIDKAGLMPENFFLYYEEMDWCERFKQAGYRLMINTNALIYHKESISVGANSPLKEYFMNRNRILFARRNSPPAARLFFYVYFILLVCTRNILVYIAKGNFAFIPVLLRAVWWNVTNNKDSTVLGYTLK